MTAHEVWQARAMAERGLILQILYVAPLASVDRATIEGAAACVGMLIEPEHMNRHLHDMSQRGWIGANRSTLGRLTLMTYELLPPGREIVLGVRSEATVQLPAEYH